MRVLMIDDHALFRMGLSELLQRRGIEVVAALGDCEQGIRWVEENTPDVVLLDMRMPAMNGLEVLRELRRREVGMPVVMLTTSRDESDVVNALQNGASGYLLKDMEPDGLVSALRDIHAGKTVVAPPLTSVLVRFVKGDMTVSQSKGPFSELTPRESEILELMAEGQGNKLIARNLGISDGTVKLHVKAVLRKLNVHSRVEAAVMYIEHNYRAAEPADD